MPTDQSDTASCDVSSQRVEGAGTCQCLADSGKQADYLETYQVEGGLAVLKRSGKTRACAMPLLTRSLCVTC